MSVLGVRGLAVDYAGDGAPVRAVDGVDVEVGAGEVVGLAGESGCGKSTVALAIARLLPPGARTTADELRFDGIDLLALDESGMRPLRWSGIAVVFQGAMNAFNPVMTIGGQIAEAIVAHEPDAGRTAVRARVRELLGQVGIAPDRANEYPHRFSGGMKQRALIAMALACRPKLLIADEPTTALDVMTQAQILELVRRLADELGLAMLVISHDLAVLTGLCDRAAVMYAGRIVEEGPARTVFRSTGAAHPYTRALLASYPSADGFQGIPGGPPDLADPPAGCRFHDRCDVAVDRCSSVDPVLVPVGPAHRAACLLAGAP